MKKIIAMLAMLSLVMFSVFSCDAADEASGDGAFYIGSSAVTPLSSAPVASIAALSRQSGGGTLDKTNYGDTNNIPIEWGGIPDGANYLYIFLAYANSVNDVGLIDWAVEVNLNDFSGEKIEQELGGTTAGADERMKTYAGLLDNKMYRLIGIVTKEQADPDKSITSPQKRDLNRILEAAVPVAIESLDFYTGQINSLAEFKSKYAVTDDDVYGGSGGTFSLTGAITSLVDYDNMELTWSNVPASAKFLYVVMKDNDTNNNTTEEVKWLVEVSLEDAAAIGVAPKIPAQAGFINSPFGVSVISHYREVAQTDIVTLYAVENRIELAALSIPTVEAIEGMLNTNLGTATLASQ